MLTICAAALTSCFRNYYKVVAVPALNARQAGTRLDSFSAAGRYLILRNGLGNAYRINNFRLGDGGQTATLTLSAVGADHQLYLKEGVNSNHRYRSSRSEQKPVVNEVHAYIPFDTAVKEGSYTLNLNAVQKIDVLKRDAKRSVGSHVLGGLGIASGVGVVAIVIALAAWGRRGH